MKKEIEIEVLDVNEEEALKPKKTRKVQIDKVETDSTSKEKKETAKEKKESKASTKKISKSEDKQETTKTKKSTKKSAESSKETDKSVKSKKESTKKSTKKSSTKTKSKDEKEVENVTEEEVEDKKTSSKKKGFHVFTIFVVILDIIVICGLVIINLDGFKNFWIPTAMTTKDHRYLAYTLYSQATIDKVMSSNYIEQNTDEVNLNDIVIGNTSEKTHYASKYEKELYTRDEGNDVYKIIRLDEGKYKGYLTVIYDPSDVELATPQKLGKAGESVNTMCKKNGGLVGINGGGFEDLDGWGNGSIPYGAIIKDGQLIWQHSGGSGQLIGFTKDHKLLLTNDAPEVAIANGMVDAVEFGPNLIVNGKVSKIHGDGGWGTAPRTIIAQRRDGIVLFLVIEGRLPGYSIGATMNDAIEMLLRYGAYNAANLDGGASSTMSVNGKLHNRPSAGGEYGGRTVSNAWIVTNKNNKLCNGCTSGAK